MRESKKFSEVASRKIVMEVLSGTLTKEQARHVYGIKSKSAILEWMRIFAGLERRVPKDERSISFFISSMSICSFIFYQLLTNVTKKPLNWLNFESQVRIGKTEFIDLFLYPFN
jgi:hypothetical protein